MPERHWLRTLGVELPVIQAPMAGAQDEELACAVALAGGLGSLPCALLSPAAVAEQVQRYREKTRAKVNLNFFCHRPPPPSLEALAAWRARLEPYYREFALGDAAAPAPARRPFDAEMCAAVEALKPEVVSFHFGLPDPALVARVRATGATIVSSATTVAEARALEAGGVHAIIAQGAEAGGHRGTFSSDGADDPVLGTFALLPQIVDAVRVPVIAAGGVADARGVAAARALGASAVQVGTAYLRTKESRISAAHRSALAAVRDDSTRVTNVLTGRLARGIVNRVMRDFGNVDRAVPPFPLAAAALAPLRAHAEAAKSGDFSPLWAGQAAALGGPTDAGELTRLLASGWERGA
ncbi:MAG TPA: nitronate monooxygenase [Polyangiaceae bacterium]|nr:nitronate monooxygenase [Polyangiaceae bacterium]